MSDTRYVITCLIGCGNSECEYCQNRPDRGNKMLVGVAADLDLALEAAKCYEYSNDIHQHDFMVEICTTSGVIPV